MMHSQFSLLKERRFLPLFITQFLGAFHDNLFKNALVVLLLYDIGIGAAMGDFDPKLLVTVAAGLFILPFVLFSALGGQLADKYPKEKIIRILKVIEIFIALMGALALWQGHVWLALFVLFSLGAQSAFFGPSKYSFLPQHLQREELIGGNALLNTGTFLAILFGTITGATLVLQTGGTLMVGAMLLICAFSGYVASLYVPHSPPRAPDIALDLNFFHEIRQITGFVAVQGRVMRQAIIGVGWFYFLGGMFMAQFPNYTKEALGANEHVLAFFLVLFSIGVSLGGLLNNSLLGGRIRTIYVPWALCGISVFSADLYFAAAQIMPVSGPVYTGLPDFLAQLHNWRVVFDILMIAICGGLFVVPLNAVIQDEAVPERRARILAGSAIINALFIVSASVIAGLLITKGIKIAALILFFAVISLPLVPLLRNVRPEGSGKEKRDE